MAALDARLAGLQRAARRPKPSKPREARKSAAAAATTEQAEARVKDSNGQVATLREAVRSAIGERDARLREERRGRCPRRATAARSLDEIEARVKAAAGEEAAIGNA